MLEAAGEERKEDIKELKKHKEEDIDILTHYHLPLPHLRLNQHPVAEEKRLKKNYRLVDYNLICNIPYNEGR